MVKYKTEVVELKGTNAYDVATTLACLADFGRTLSYYTSKRYHEKIYPNSGKQF
jgi:hypothetical protein